MNGLIEFTHYQAEALIACLALSVAWAGVLFLGAQSIERNAPMTSAERLWTAALLFAVLPSLIAPTLAAFGVSLRPASEPAVFEPVRTLVAASTATTAAAAAVAAERPVFLTGKQLIGSAALIYVYGVFLAFFLWAAKNAGLYYAVARATDVTEQRFLGLIDEWAERLGVETPRIRRSRHVSSVCIFGVVRQTILIPEGIDARVSSDDLLLMCAHELAHVRRGDTRLFTATQLARVLFWFNPLVARIASHAELAAEECADALVIARGVDRRRYAATFVEGLKFAASKTIAQPGLAPSFTPPDRHGRRRRLNSILSPEPERKVRLSTRLLLSAAASSMALIAFGQAALAVDPDIARERRVEKEQKKTPLPDGVTTDDIRSDSGAIVAPADGVVVEAADRSRRDPEIGKVVIIDHGHGRITHYARLDSLKVKEGDRVKEGDTIGTDKSGKLGFRFDIRDAAPVIEPAADPVDAVEPMPAPEPPGMIEPSPAVEPAPAAEPAPRAREFSFRFSPEAMKFPEFKFINPVVRGTPLVAPAAKFAESFASAYPSAPLVFAYNDESGALMGEDLEEQLLGAIDGDSDVVYNLTFRNGDKVHRFSSDEMTAEKRAELRRMLGEMRKERENAREDWRREAELAEREAEREAARAERDAEREAMRAEAEAEREAMQEEAEAQREAMREAMQAHREAMLETQHDWRMDADELRAEIEMTKRDALEAHLEALDEAKSDLDETVAAQVDDALASLDDALSDLGDYDLSSEELEVQREAIEDARRELERDRDVHERAIDEARRDLEAQRREVERMIRELDAESANAP